MEALTITAPTAATEPSVSIVKSEINMLTKHDRCDECRSQAFGRVTLRESGFELLWCGHHLAKYLAKLLPLASKVEDYRQAINEKP